MSAPAKPRLVFIAETVAVDPGSVVAIDFLDGPQPPVRVRLRGGAHYRVLGTVASVAAALGFDVATAEAKP